MNQDRAGGAAELIGQLSQTDRRSLLKDLLRQRRGAEDQERIPRRSLPGPWPLSFAQQRLWVVDRLEPDGAAYNLPYALRLRGDLDVAALRAGLDALVARHETLRTVFAEQGGAPVQVVQPAAPTRLVELDMRGLPEAEREAEAARLAVEEAQRPFDLARGPLLRCTLLRLDDTEHVLCFTMHHIVSDGWSRRVLVREISALYAAFSRGEEPGLPEMPVQYADFAVWQRERLGGAVLEEQLRFWRERLAGAPPLLDLPLDRPRVADASPRGAVRSFAIPARVAEGLRELSRSEGTTLFMTVLAGWQALLSAYSGQDDVVVGTTVAGRARVETEGLIGFFVNVLPLRVDLSGDPTWTELLGRVRESALGAYSHQEVPFERLVEALAVERSLAHAPIFQVTFDLESAAAGENPLALGTLAAEPFETGAVAAKFDLELSLGDGGDALGGALLYRADLFEADTIARMAAQLESVLATMAAHPARRISELSLLRGDERARVLHAWNATARDFPGDLCLHELVAAQARRTPDAPALVFEGRPLAYAELDAGADRLARLLRRRGVGPEARVAISLEKGPEMALAVLGVLKAGGAYVPVDPAYPAERIAYVLADSGAALLLTQARLADRFAAGGIPVLALDDLGDELAAAPDRAPGSGVTPDNLAYVIYTSGSTGQPKGVGVPHRAVVNLATDMAGRLGLRPDDRLLQFASLSFDVSVEEIFTAWTAGAAVVLSRAELFAPGELRRTVEREGITSFELPSAFWAEWVRELRESGLGVPECVRFVRVGGERVAPERLREWAPLGVPLLHVYGVTEATCTSAALWVEPGEDAGARASLPIGTPTGNVRLYVLDGSGEPLPVGVPGELCVGGAQVARGYLGRPALTAEKFVPDPFSAEPGARLYRTGDRARWLASGEVDLLGRMDTQVKLRGFRIEPGEIEAVLRAHPRVREAVVAVREDVPGEKRLVAYVVPAAAEIPLAAELMVLLRERLPEHMVPAALVELDELPLSVSGKVDRRALPAPAYGSAEERYVAPRTATEEVLAGIWAEVLGAERIGVEESFFTLGGHSLLATQAVARARLAFGVEVPLRAFFEAPTVAGMARHVEALRGQGAGAAPPIARVERAGPPPASFAQQRLWLVDRMEPGSAAYNMPGALRLRGSLDPAALRAGLDALVARHETLRTTFAEGEDGPVQVVHAPAPAALSFLDLQGVPEAEREAERLADAEALRPFDLARGPLLRCTLLRLGTDDHVLCFTMHHVVSDGWSMQVLVREISALYDASSRGEVPRLPELPVQYADFAVWQREWLSGATLEERIGFWKETLRGAPALLEVPTDRPREPGQSPLAASHPVRLSPELSRGLRALSRREGTTLFMTVLAAWQSLLARWSGQDDVVVGSPVAGRSRHEVEGLIGFFVNMLALRADLGGDPAWSELLARTRDAALGAYDHQELPFERLVEELGVQRSPLHSPVFQAAFALEPAAGGDERGEPGSLRLEPFGGGERVAKFDLFLAMADGGEALGGTLVYRRALFEPETIARMAGHLETVLEAMAADPAGRPSGLSLLRGAERTQVLEAWNATAADLPRACVHELFAGQAARTPGAVAIVAGEETVTYAELERRADRLAHLLRGRGVDLETRVGVCLERGIPAVVAILAVLKAGGAYVPVAPSDPAERLREVFADAGVRLVLTDAAAGAQLPGSVEPLWLDSPETAAELNAMPETVPEAPSDPAQLAYVIYTSGSTGTPKGVAVAHRSVVRLVRGTRYVPFGPEERIAHVSNLAFDAATFELWGALLNGGSLAVVEREVLLSPAAFAAELRRTQATAMFLTAALFNRIAHEEPDAFATCRHVLVGGEAVDAQSMRRVQEAGGPLRLLNGYGPTEATTFAAWHEVGPVEPGARTVPIGRPLGNTTLYVLDAAGEALPSGVPGELHVGGLALARGYLGQPAMTAGKFVPDPFGSVPGARLYRTGDRVRWTAAGQVEYLGRMDQQVKVRGFRIEPAEVEAVLLAHDSVAEAVVAVREDVPGEKRLVAYVVPTEGARPESAELRARLAARLPEHMVPGAFVVLEKLPLTANGKVDRGALPAPDLDAAGAVPPRTPAEEVLAGIWGEVLGLERVGVTDGFFELGGHSLLATQVVSRARHAFGVEVPLRTFFEAPTVAALAAAVEALRGAGGVAAPPMERVPRTARSALPLSFAQQRLWLMDRMEPGSPAYNMPFPLRLRGPLDAAALRASLDALVARHETLRTVFAERDAGPVQVIHPAAPVELAEMDLRELPEAEREPAAERLAADDAIRPFDLARGPLLRSTLLRLGEEDHVLFLTLHHVVSDGWSMQVLVREVSALYNAFSRGEEAHLPELPVQYADFAVWQRAWMSGEVLEAQLAYWRERLADAPPLLEMPTDHPRATGQSALAGSRAVALSPGLSRGLRALSHREGATLFMTTLAAWQVLLGRYAGQDDVVVGTPIAGRNRRETEGLIGFFVNMLPLRADLSGNATWTELLGRVRATALGAYDHQDLPFERLVDELGVERSLTHSPVFQAVFTLNRAGGPDGPTPAGGLELEPFGAGAGVAKYDLDLVLADAGEALGGAIVYRGALFEPDTIARMAEHLEALLEHMAAEPGRRLSEVSLLRGAELAQVLHAWSATRAEDPQPTLHELFARQAERTPHAVAVVFEDRALTYAELHAGAARLARHLRAHGVRTETRVALCAERSPELIVGILGILAAGGVYVPVDPVYPAGRIAYLLEDSGCAAVLVQASLRERIPAAAARVLTLEDAIADGAPDPDAPAEVRPDNAAYVIYTSGSTGRPKGVVVTHANVARLFQATQPWFGFGADDVWTLFHSYAFDFSVWEIWGALLHGGRLVVVPWETSRSPERFHDLLVREGVTVLSQTPSAFRQLDQVEQTRGVPAGLALRLVVFGGEALEPRSLRAWLERHGAESPRLVNMYGITETTVHVTYRPIGWEEVEAAGASPIGTAIPDLGVRVLDPWGNPVPTGVPGELYVGGGGVARGYLGRAELTAERFVPDALGREAGARLYRTGDRVRWLASGELEYLGRMDRQVKIRGFRIEPGEVEAALAGVAGVREAVVTVREDVPGEKRLVAYVVPAEEGGISGAGLREELGARLPEHLVPGAFVVLEQLPLTSHGKVDRRALPAPQPGAETVYVAPRTEIEEMLCTIWLEVLTIAGETQAERVGIHDNFFLIGGHSLLATQVIARIREVFGMEVPMQSLFASPTVAGLAEVVEQQLILGADAAELEEELSRLEPASGTDAVP